MTLFKDLKRQLAEIQKPRTLHDLHNIAGRATHQLVMDGFRREASPYGSPWAPTKRRNPILQDTLALRDGIKWKADSRGLVIRTSGKANAYAAYHQRGTGDRVQPVNRRGRFRSRKSTARLKASVGLRHIPGLPARPFLPDEGQIPPAYEARLRNEFSRYLKQRFG